MRIALISDIHDHISHLEWALAKITQANANQIFCLGDITSGVTTKLLANGPIPVISVFGNNDGDKANLMKIALSNDSNLTFLDREWGEREIDDKKYFLTHYPDLAEDIAYSGKYDVVFHGHTHRQRTERIDSTLVINPGELAGYRSGVISFALFDTKTEKVEFVEKKE